MLKMVYQYIRYEKKKRVILFQLTEPQSMAAYGFAREIHKENKIVFPLKTL